MIFRAMRGKTSVKGGPIKEKRQGEGTQHYSLQISLLPLNIWLIVQEGSTVYVHFLYFRFLLQV